MYSDIIGRLTGHRTQPVAGWVPGLNRQPCRAVRSPLLQVEGPPRGKGVGHMAKSTRIDDLMDKVDRTLVAAGLKDSGLRRSIRSMLKEIAATATQEAEQRNRQQQAETAKE